MVIFLILEAAEWMIFSKTGKKSAMLYLFLISCLHRSACFKQLS